MMKINKNNRLNHLTLIGLSILFVMCFLALCIPFLFKSVRNFFFHAVNSQNEESKNNATNRHTQENSTESEPSALIKIGRQINKAMNDGNHECAEKLLSKIIDTDTSCDDDYKNLALFFRGSVKLKRGDYVGAELDLSKAIDSKKLYYGFEMKALFYRVYANYNQNKFDKVMSDAKAYIHLMLPGVDKAVLHKNTLDKEMAQVLFIKGIIEYKQFNNEDARSDFTKAIALGTLPESQEATARILKGVIEFHLGNNEVAISDIDSAIATNKLEDKLEAEGFLHRGYAKLNLSNYAGAISDIDNAFATNKLADKFKAGAFLNRGNAKFNLSNYDGAISDIDSAFATNKLADELKAGAFLTRGLAKFNLSNYAGAISDLESAIASPVKASLSKYDRANALLRIGDAKLRLNSDDDEAASRIEQAIATAKLQGEDIKYAQALLTFIRDKTCKSPRTSHRP